MDANSRYLNIEIQLDNGEKVIHQEFYTTDEKIAFNNFMKKIDLNETGFLPVNEHDCMSTINIDKIVRITPKNE
ncbi:hypothetical protein [Macrococcoides caseolyticum]|uniref:hypothetical protein n=1 Tax=Macrococcoides caseolyticum TaxID=69966 RepID=UPI001F2CE8F4|nr:hypothetical protein [Macrococcus caseolyticus]MCE4957416.1 hypothetical protein [Macrococcus caseolyticus]